ncbi:hypothetical protein CALVIDRAFT_542920 [Calocera viscosa TUFC12733]|uniref:Uncharacterized protein n=1 Tax=Calocera viscosa (strain TUFC12733) TaxID=1330018 RepID=A0A167G4T5_CALVF|nr:hypothetical protein CALVIDRAFT_542920 [Calocera viscosa TUFC12733]
MAAAPTPTNLQAGLETATPGAVSKPSTSAAPALAPPALAPPALAPPALAPPAGLARSKYPWTGEPAAGGPHGLAAKSTALSTGRQDGQAPEDNAQDGDVYVWEWRGEELPGLDPRMRRALRSIQNLATSLRAGESPEVVLLVAQDLQRKVDHVVEWMEKNQKQTEGYDRGVDSDVANNSNRHDM